MVACHTASSIPDTGFYLMTSHGASNTALLRLGVILLLGVGIIEGLPRTGLAQSEPSDRPAESLIRAQVADILSQPEYQTQQPIWLARLMDRALEFVIRLLRAIFDNPAMQHLYATRPLFYWLLIAGLLAAASLLLYHILVTIRSAFGGTRGKRRGRAATAPLPVTSPAELRRRAGRLAGQGNFAAALLALYQACLRRLERQGHLRYRPWLTNGEYLQTVRPKPELFDVLAPLTRAVDGISYGRRPLAAGAYHELDALADELWQEAGG